MTISNNKFQTLQQALLLTQNMLSLAKKEQWEELTAIDKQRQPLFQAVFPLEENTPETETLATLLQKLISTNEELIAQCQHGKHALQLQMSNAKFTRKAVTAYQSN